MNASPGAPTVQTEANPALRWWLLLTPLAAFAAWLVLFLFVYCLILFVVAIADHGNVGFWQSVTAFNHNRFSEQTGELSLYAVVLFALLRVARKNKLALIAGFSSVSASIIGIGAALGAFLAAGEWAIERLLANSGLIDFHISNAAHAGYHAFALEPWLATLIGVGVLGPLAEELYFRGILLSWLCRKMTALSAILLSAVLFSFVHFRFVQYPGAGGWLLTAGIFVLGLINANWALKSKSLWPGIAVHAASNVTFAVLPLLAG